MTIEDKYILIESLESDCANDGLDKCKGYSILMELHLDQSMSRMWYRTQLQEILPSPNCQYVYNNLIFKIKSPVELHV